jgi:hypothetical protein
LKNQPVRFGSIILKKKKKPNRTEPKQKKNGKKPSQTRKTEPKPEKTELKPRKPSQNSLNRFLS